MAKAIAMCKCEKCGQTFKKVKACGNRSEADSYVAWAEEHFTLCPDCYAAEQAAKMEETYEIREMHYGEYKEHFSDCKTVPNSYDSKKKTIRVYVKKEIPEAPAEPEKEESANTKASESEKEEKIAEMIRNFMDVYIRISNLKGNSHIKEHSRIIKKDGNFVAGKLQYTDDWDRKMELHIVPEQKILTLHYCIERWDNTWQPAWGSCTIPEDLLKEIAIELKKQEASL